MLFSLTRRSKVRFRGQTGKHLLSPGFTGFDPKADLTRARTERNVAALVVEDRRRGFSTSICHRVEVRTDNGGPFRASGRDRLKDHLVEMIQADIDCFSL